MGKLLHHLLYELIQEYMDYFETPATQSNPACKTVYYAGSKPEKAYPGKYYKL